MGKRTELSIRTVPKLFGVREAKETRAEWDLVAVMINGRCGVKLAGRVLKFRRWPASSHCLFLSRRDATPSPTLLPSTLHTAPPTVSSKFKAGQTGNHVAPKIQKTTSARIS